MNSSAIILFYHFICKYQNLKLAILSMLKLCKLHPLYLLEHPIANTYKPPEENSGD